MSSYCVEEPEFYAEAFYAARKVHECVECDAPIEVGERHLAYSGKWAGEISHGRQHMLCRELCMLIRDEFQDGECIALGDLHEAWHELDWRCRGTGDPWSPTDRKARSLYAKIRARERAAHRQRGAEK